jgi:hypothetical protein
VTSFFSLLLGALTICTNRYSTACLQGLDSLLYDQRGGNVKLSQRGGWADFLMPHHESLGIGVTSADADDTATATATKLRGVNVADDIRIAFYTRLDAKGKERKKNEAVKQPKPAFAFWFHVSHETGATFRLERKEIDGVRKAPTRFPSNFGVDLYFGDDAGDASSSSSS